MSSPQTRSKPKIFVKQPGASYPGKGLLLFFLPLATLFAIVKAFASGHFLAIAVNAGCYALFLGGALLLRKGLAAETEYHKKKITYAPKPYKKLAAGFIAGATGIIAWMGAHYPVGVSALFGLGAFLGMYLSYGFDPGREKKALGDHGYSTEEIVRTITEAEDTIDQIETSGRSLENSEFRDRLDRICQTARGVVAGLEEDPSDIRRTRKFLHVYLDSTRKVTEGYGKTQQKVGSTELESNFRKALETLETEFQRQQQKLLDDDVFDLDVQIEVLTKQLKRDGVL